MIYRIVDTNNNIVKSIDAPSENIAKLYLEYGQRLVIAGSQLQVNDDLIFVANGVLSRKDGVADIGGYVGEGDDVHELD